MESLTRGELSHASLGLSVTIEEVIMKSTTKTTKVPRTITDDAIIIASVGLVFEALGKRRLASLEKALENIVCTISDDICMHLSPTKDAAFHWSAMMEKLPQGMEAIGMTERQAQVGMGVIRQQTYEQIAQEVRLDERTVRQHASYAFRKVGCTKRSEFLAALLARIKSLR